MQGVAGANTFGLNEPSSGQRTSVYARLRLFIWVVAAPIALLCLTAPLTQACAMTFAVSQLGTDTGGICGQGCEQVISAKGDIESGATDRFLNFLSNHQQEQNLRPVILLDSGGGSVEEAMKLGSAFRQMGAEVIVGETVRTRGTDRMSLTPGQCMSACVYAFFGGAQRVVPSGSQLGIHRMVLDTGSYGMAGGAEQQTYGSPEIVASLTAYTRSMGVDPNVIVQAERIAHESIHILTPGEITRWRLARSHL